MIENAKSFLKKYPDLNCEIGDGYINVFPSSPDGFVVSFSELRGDPEEKYLVSFEGWHESFSNSEQAFRCFKAGLSSNCRLQIFERGKKQYKWILEVKEDGEWKKHSVTAWIFFPYWRRRTIKVYQNQLTDIS
jgi:hypothetical protein